MNYYLDLKKRPSKKKKRKSTVFKSMLLFSFFFLVSLFAFVAADFTFFIRNADSATVNRTLKRFIDTSAGIVNKIIEPELKHSEGLTSVLLVGVDTRDVAFVDGEFVSTNPEGQAGTRNTDTIIQAVFDHYENKLYLISLPRDLGVDLETECFKFHGSIHWVYDKAQRSDCPLNGVEALNQVVESVTGIPVHYHGYVTLSGFEEVIASIGEFNPDTGETGIYIDNPERIWEVYPANDYGWENVFFDEGQIFLTPERALKYVRSRQTTTDFGRANRQQILIEAIIRETLSSSTLLNPGKIKSLLETYEKETIITMPTLQEISAALAMTENLDSLEIINMVLDPNMGGDEAYLNKQPHDRPGGPYYMVPTHWKECGTGNEFCRIRQYIKQTMAHPQAHQEQAEIFVYAHKNNAGRPDFSQNRYQDLLDADYPLKLTHSRYLVNTSSHPELENYRDLVVIDYSEGKFPATKELLGEQLGISVLPGDNYVEYRINKENFLLIVF